MKNSLRPFAFVPRGLLVLFVLAVAGSAFLPRTQNSGPAYVPLALADDAAPAADPAAQARDILAANCASCHNGFRFNATEAASLTAREVVPGKPDASPLYRRVAGMGGVLMPAGGYQGVAGQKLPPDQVLAIRNWILAGAPDWKTGAGLAPAAPRDFVSEKEVLDDISRDLDNADAGDKPYLRYFTLNTLYNDPTVSDADLDLYRTTLSKLANSLSWQDRIAHFTPIDPNQLILRLDLRDFGWTAQIWTEIIWAYPYGYKDRHYADEVDAIQNFNGAALPYVRADWFIAAASVPPLYNQVLQLPDDRQALESKLGINVAQDLQGETAVRVGLRESAESPQNRVLERHPTQYGGCWKTFEFATSQNTQNIFTHPMDFQEEGSEFIFDLPNGLQGYLVATKMGKQLDVAPPNLVFDRAHKNDDPQIQNGSSCISCHYDGLKPATDAIRSALQLQPQDPDFDLTHGLAIYKSQQDIDALLEADSKRFQDALAETGSALPVSRESEPISLLAGRYACPVGVVQAAAECGMQPPEFLMRLKRSALLEQMGFNQLEHPNGTVKRDLWEQQFRLVA